MTAAPAAGNSGMPASAANAMRAISRIEGLAAAVYRENIDTDVLIPSRDITAPAREGYGEKLFAPWRYTAPGGPENPDFVLNREPWRTATVLIAGANFGCGSSREMAVWALAQFGFRCVIAPSFGAIFRNNCVRNFLLPVELPGTVVQELANAAAAAPVHLIVDLQTCTVTAPGGETAPSAVHPFNIDADDRASLLAGLDAIDQTWLHRAAIQAFEAADRQRRPWVWAAAPDAPALAPLNGLPP